MPYWVYGHDSERGEPTDPFFSEADNEAAARAEATAQRMTVESVELHIEDETSEEPRSVLDPGPPPPQWPPYEFTEEQSDVIRSLALYMGIFGAITILCSGLAVILAAREPPALIGCVLGLIVGVLTFSAAGCFRRVATTRGRDMEHLMDALSALKWVYAIVIVLIIALVAVLFTHAPWIR